MSESPISTIFPVHNSYPVNVLHHMEAMSNKNIGKAQFGTGFFKQIQDLSLNRNIKGRNRLITYNQFWPEGNCPGNSYTLPLAA